MNQISDNVIRPPELTGTRKEQIIVEYLTNSGSAFAVNAQGEQVFLNARMVSTMNVKAGQTYEAFLLVNYPDKRDQIPWRAMRVEPVNVPLDLNHVSEDAELNAIIKIMQEYDGYWTPAELADELDISYSKCADICRRHRAIFFEVESFCLHLHHK